MRIASLVLLTITLTVAASAVSAQSVPDSSRFDQLEAEIRASVIPDRLYYEQLEDAWDRAVVTRQFGRADSVALLAERLIAASTGWAQDSLAWPGLENRLALSLLQGDVEAVEALADPASWRGLPRSPSQRYGLSLDDRRRALADSRPLRMSVWNVLSQDSARAVEQLVANGAEPEAVAVARLTIRRLLARPSWNLSLRDPMLTPAQTELNTEADAFLSRYPGGRFEPFVREVVRIRYRADGAISMYLGFGPGWGAGELGDATRTSIAGELGLGVRYRWAHASLGFHGSDLRVTESRAVGAETLEAGDRLSFALLGVDVGPRLTLGGLDVLPYVAGGLLVQGVSGRNANTPELSTYEPPERLGWGYGVSLEYLGGRARRFGGTAVRLRAGRLLPQLADDLAMDDPVTYVSLGMTLTGVMRRRLY